MFPLYSLITRSLKLVYEDQTTFCWNSAVRVNTSSFTILFRRWAKLVTGLAFIGFSIAFMKHANLGLGPWDVLNDSLAGLTGIQLGTVSIVVGAIVVLLWIPMRERPGVALIPSIVLIGAFTNIGMALVESASSALLRTAWLITGIFLASFGSALYLGSQLGAGPRDGLMLGLSRKTGWSVGRTRTALEVTVLVVGWILGGAVGIGTVISALTIGPAIQFMAGKAGRHLEKPVKQPHVMLRQGV